MATFKSVRPEHAHARNVRISCLVALVLALCGAGMAENVRWKSRVTSATVAMQPAVQTQAVSPAIPLRTASTGIFVIVK